MGVAELVRGPAYRRPGGWRGINDLDFAVMGWVAWYNTDRLHGESGQVPPAEHEAAYWVTHATQATEHAADEPHHHELADQPGTSPDDANEASHAEQVGVDQALLADYLCAGRQPRVIQ